MLLSMLSAHIHILCLVSTHRLSARASDGQPPIAGLIERSPQFRGFLRQGLPGAYTSIINNIQGKSHK
jgi:hypothetical protein